MSIKIPEAVESGRLWLPVSVLLVPALQLQHEGKVRGQKPTSQVSQLSRATVHIWFTSLLECGGQREEIRIKETKVSVLHMIPYDGDQPAPWELQVITGDGKKVYS